MKLCACGCGEPAPIAKKNDRWKGWIKGEPLRFVHGHNARGSNSPNWRGGRWASSTAGYVRTRAVGHDRAQKNVALEHVLIAERALGKPLPSHAEVHHVNEIKSDNRPSNLVICQDRAYHMLLHQRLRALDACGHAGWNRCVHCKHWGPPTEVIRYRRGTLSAGRHRTCQLAYQRERRMAAAR